MLTALQLDNQSPNSLRSLGHVSRFYRSLVDPVLYRSVRLADGLQRGHTMKTASAVFYRLLDPTDILAGYVSELDVGSPLLVDAVEGAQSRNDGAESL